MIHIIFALKHHNTDTQQKEQYICHAPLPFLKYMQLCCINKSPEIKIHIGLVLTTFAVMTLD